ncbi:hypothetical protein ID866_11536, partial [Astraeus odoratus]
MGLTGSGKSNFINKLTGRTEEWAAGGLKSHTQSIEEYELHRCGRRYVFVDTPGFNHTYRSDRNIFRTIADWLVEKFRAKINLAGIIYTHRITDSYVFGRKNLDLLAKMCGDKATMRVRMVTTMWDKIRDQTVAETRVELLEKDFWRPLLDAGAQHRQFRNTFKDAWDIVDDLVGETVTLLLQEELVDASMQLSETTAGKVFCSKFERILYEHRETIKQLEREARAQEDPELVQELHAEYKKIEVQLRKTWKEIEKWDIPFGLRIALFFSQKTRSVSINSACL